jgi:ABC-type dipeptide/oligopeptide/nickel transport system ATPase component
VQAVSGVSLSVRPGEAVALIGESGSGKSVTLRTLLRLHPERKTTMKGKVQVAGHDVLALKGKALNAYRGKTCAMIFQEPLLALDPVYPVGAQIVEAIRRHEPGVPRPKRSTRAAAVRARAHSQPGAAPEGLPARDVRRHAPARHDRAGPGLQPAGAAGRRTHHRTGRHGADPDPAAAARTAARAGPV